MNKEEPPPFLGTWNRVYGVVMVYLVVIIAALWLFSRSFAP